MAVPVGAVILASIRGRCFGQRILLTQTYVCSTSPSGGSSYFDNMSAFLDTWTGGVGGVLQRYLALLSGDYTATDARAQQISPTRQVYVSLGLGGAAGQGDSATTANIAGALTMKTDKAGRNQVATKHLGPLPAEASIAGYVVEGTLALMRLFGTELLKVVNPIGGGVYSPCIAHRGEGGAITGTDLLTTRFAQDTTRVMRRRTVGHGE